MTIFRALFVLTLALPASAATQSFNNARFAQPGFLPFQASPSAVAALGEILSVPQGDLQVPAPEAELAAVAKHFGRYAERLADAVLSPAEGAAAVLPQELGLPAAAVELAQRLEDLEALAQLLPSEAPQRARLLQAVSELARRQGPQASHFPPMPSLLADLEVAGARLGTYLGHESEIHSVALAPNGQSVAAAGMTSEFSGVAILWADTGARLREFADDAPLTSVDFTPDGINLLTGSWMGAVRSWEAATGGLRREFDSLQKRALTVAMSPDRRLLAAGLGPFSRVWDAVTGEVLHTFASSDHTRVAFSPTGAQLFSGGDQGNNVAHMLWDATGGQLIREFTTKTGERAGVYAATFDPAGKRVLTAAHNGAIVWDADTGAQTHRLAHGKQVKSLAFSPDGKKALTADADKIHLWDAKAWWELRAFRVNGAVLLSVVFRADGAYALTQTPDHAVHLWKIPAE